MIRIGNAPAGRSIKLKLASVGLNFRRWLGPPGRNWPPGFTEPLPAESVHQTYPRSSTVSPHISPALGTVYSLKVLFAGSNLPSLVELDSVNQTTPFLSTSIARGPDWRVGTAYSSMYLGRLEADCKLTKWTDSCDAPSAMMMHAMARNDPVGVHFGSID